MNMNIKDLKKSILKELYEQEEIPASEESPSQIVAKAIDNTDPAYMERSLAQRTPGPAASIQEGFTSARWQRLANIIKG